MFLINLIHLNMGIYYILLCLAFTLVEPKIKVHIVPHTHNDLGWGNTVEEYYNGGINGYCTKCILDSMVEILSENESRTYTFSESAYFEMWYSKQSQETRQKVKGFIKSGRLEFINGGWSMSDEATPRRESLLENFRLGTEFLYREFGVIPRTSWQIDPFGHSRGFAQTVLDLGYENLVICRIDHQEKEARKANKTMEFKWIPSEEETHQYNKFLGKQQAKRFILTHICLDSYTPHESFQKILGFERINWEKSLLSAIYDYILELSLFYNSDEVMILMGSDFSFRNPSHGFPNIDSLISSFMQDNKYSVMLEMFYSTPGRYFESLRQGRISGLPEQIGGDFFPYSDHPLDYWTGFYTSRPFLKGLIRDAYDYLSRFSQFMVDRLDGAFSVGDNLHLLRSYLGISHHHDAITGTSYEYVASDYIEKLNKGISSAREHIKGLIQADLSKHYNDNSLHISDVCLMNSLDPGCKDYREIPADGLVIALINSDLRTEVYPFTLRISHSTEQYEVTRLSPSEEKIDSHLFCFSEAKCKLLFYVDKSDSLQYLLFRIKPTSSDSGEAPKLDFLETPQDEIMLWKLDGANYVKYFRQINKLEYLIDGVPYSLGIAHGHFTYNFKADRTRRPRQGTYLMGVSQEMVIEDNILDIGVLIKENLVEVKISYQASVLILRMHRGIPHMRQVIEVESFLKEFNLNAFDEDGYEYMLKLSSDIANTNADGLPEFYTDSIGFNPIKRTKKGSLAEANFYPVSQYIGISESGGSGRHIGILNDRSQGGSSLTAGEILLSMNRWGKLDDGKGLGHGGLNEEHSKIDFHTRHWILVGRSLDYRDLLQVNRHRHLYSIVSSADSRLFVAGPSLKRSEIVAPKENVHVDYSIVDDDRVLITAFCLDYSLLFNLGKAICQVDIGGDSRFKEFHELEDLKTVAKHLTSPVGFSRGNSRRQYTYEILPESQISILAYINKK